MKLATLMTVLAITTAVLATASGANAVDKCKVKVDSKTGAIQVSASNVGGSLLFGDGPSPFQTTSAFANAATCLDAGKAKKCELGAPGSAEQITPPQLCRLFLRDTSGPGCSAFIKGCTPGVREVPAGPAPAGGAKAGVIAECSFLASEAVITRSFNHVNGSAITINDGVLPGRCEITFPFSLSDKFFSVETVGGPTSGTTFKLDYSVSGSTLSIGTVQYFPPAWVGATETVSVLIF
jgi:hypothetical protein